LRIKYGKSPKTYERYEVYFKKFKEFFKETEFLTGIKKRDAQDFANHLIEKKLAPKTIHETLAFVRRLYKNWIKYEYVSDNPFKGDGLDTPKMSKVKKPFWTPDEIESILLLAPSLEFKVYWATMYFSGLRYFEARNLSVEQINFDRKEVRIQGKMGRDDTIPVSSRLIEMWKKAGAFNKAGLLFPGLPGTNEGCLTALKKAVAELDFEDPGPVTQHRFRHSFGSNLLRNKTNIESVRSLMRHSNIETTLKHYSHVLPADLRGDTESLANLKPSANTIQFPAT